MISFAFMPIVSGLIFEKPKVFLPRSFKEAPIHPLLSQFLQKSKNSAKNLCAPDSLSTDCTRSSLIRGYSNLTLTGSLHCVFCYTGNLIK
jgi:hypothetical protein